MCSDKDSVDVSGRKIQALEGSNRERWLQVATCTYVLGISLSCVVV